MREILVCELGGWVFGFSFVIYFFRIYFCSVRGGLFERVFLFDVIEVCRRIGVGDGKERSEIMKLSLSRRDDKNL